MKMAETIKRIVRKNSHEYNVILQAIKQGEGSELLPGLKMVNMFLTLPGTSKPTLRNRLKRLFSEEGAGI